MRQGVLWTNLSLRELSRRLAAMGTPAGRRTIRRALRQLKLGRRTARKKKTMGQHPDRNAQFENIARLRQEYLQKFNAFCTELRDRARGMQVDYHLLRTDEPVDRALGAYLTRRQMRR